MRNYETIAILRSNVPDEYVGTLTKKVEKAMTAKPGSLIKKDDWGVKRLAYEIQKEKQGRYLYWSFQHLEKAPAAIDKCLRFEENVLRYMTVVSDWAPKGKAGREKKATLSEKKNTAKETETESSKDRPVIDFKDPVALSKYINEKGKIVPQRNLGVDACTQRAISKAIKRARQIALLSYTDGFSVGGHSSHSHSHGHGHSHGETERFE
ncbi:MAG: 30S ribosomal protein S6 [Bdellovibrionales bacterium]|nr:30S ribosomal protein S6 [Bdellovibrionales bacterium]